MIRTRDYWPAEGWRESAPGDQGMDAGALERARDHLMAHYPHLDSLLVIRHGYLVLDHYRAPAVATTLHNLKSATKSVLSALIGIAISTGDLTLNDSLGRLMPDLFTPADDARKRSITVRDLLAMRSGIDWDEYGASIVEITSSADWMRYVMRQPLAFAPGQRHNYSTGDTHLLSAMLQKAAGMTALEFADNYLFGQIGITERDWPADPQGITIGGAELALLPHDMAKFGYLYLNEGRWGGEQVVPAEWVRETTRQHSLVIPPAARDCPTVGYGYLWWIRPQAGYDSFMAVGYGGQFIVVIPDLDLVVVMTGDLHSPPEAFRSNAMLCRFNFVEEHLVPAVTP